MHTTRDVRGWIDQELVGQDDKKIGKIDQVYVDRETGDPKFLAVKTGLFGSNVSFVPIDAARSDGGRISVPYTKDQVKDAPNIDADADLSESEEQRIFEHYELGGGDADREDRFTRDADARGTDARGTVGHDTSGPTTDDAMTRS